MPRMRRFFIVTLIVLWSTYAMAAPLIVETEQSRGGFATQQFLNAVLHPTIEHPLQGSDIEEPRLPAGSHLRIIYRSESPVPLEVGPLHPAQADLLRTVLPASQTGDVLIPLTASPSWSGWRTGIFLRIYKLQDSDVTIVGMGMEDHLSLGGKLLAYVEQPFVEEPFNSISLGRIEGYAMGGISLNAILGIILLIITVFLAVFRRPMLIRGVAMTSLVVLFIYEGRYLADIAIATVGDQREWQGEGSYNDMGYLYAEAEVIERDDPGATTPVVTCTRLATSLKYFLTPRRVGSDPEAWAHATYGVVVPVWDDAQTQFACDNLRRSGTVVHRFPNGEAVVLFTPDS